MKGPAPEIKGFLRKFSLELLIYGVLLTVYFLLVLRFLNQPLTKLFAENLTLYGIIALLLIIAQGVLLDLVTTLMVRLLGMDRSE